MLDGIRANAQSWGVKLAFGIIILVFVFWGIGSYTGPKGYVATVNDMHITEIEFQKAYGSMEQNLRASYPDLTPELLKGLQLEQQVLQQLVMKKLLESEAGRIGLEISPYELRLAVQEMPYFLDKDGRFDKDEYLRVLKASGLTPAQFEAGLREDLLPEKLQKLLTAGAWGSPEEARLRYMYERQKRSVDYILFPISDYSAVSAPSDAEVRTAYEARASRYALPARVKLEYVLLDPEKMAEPSSVSDEAVAAAYDARKAQFAEPEKIHARHILIRVGEEAPEAEVKKAEERINEVAAKIREGLDFSDAAKEYGQDPSAAQGGDLGFFTREQMVKPFADAAFALAEGELSAPVRTQFGFHLIKVEEKQAAKQRTLDEVKDELRAALAVDAATEALQAKTDAVLAAALGNGDMNAAAARAGLQAVETGLESAEELTQSLGLRPIDVQAVMSTPPGTVVDSSFATLKGTLVIRVTESVPAMTRPLDEVRTELVAELTREKAMQAAMDAARSAAAKGLDAALLERVKRSEFFGRDGNVPGLGFNMDMARAVFSEEGKNAVTGAKWNAEPWRMEDGAVLVRLAAVEEPSAEEWKVAEPMFLSQLDSSRASVLFQNFVALLYGKADIRVLNPALIQRMETE